MSYVATNSELHRAYYKGCVFISAECSAVLKGMLVEMSVSRHGREGNKTILECFERTRMKKEEIRDKRLDE